MVSMRQICDSHDKSSHVPPIWECQDSSVSLQDCCDWLTENRDRLEQQSYQSGAVLFRGFPVASAGDFDQAIRAFGWDNFPYEESLSNAVRTNFTDRVFSANEAPADVTIFLHHEMAQTPIYPAKLFFFCEQAAETGGATPICRSDQLWSAIQKKDAEFARNCVKDGLKYTNVMPGENDASSGMGRSWQSTFRATSKAEAEERLRQLGYTWEWLDDGCLKATTPQLPAVKQLPDGRGVFFNQLIAAFQGWKDSRNDPEKSITFGNSQPLDRDTVLAISELAKDFTYDVNWRSGDFVLVDNRVVMHGRRTFTGKRKVLASLTQAEDNRFAA